jgi:carbonic anhydrase
MSKSVTEERFENNRLYASGTAVHRPEHPGPQPIRPSRRVAVVACMDARLDVEDLLGLQTGEAHIIRNAGGIVAEDTIRSLVISHHLLDTREILLIHHTRCGMLAFTDDLLKAGLEGDAAASEMLSQATSRTFVPTGDSRDGPQLLERQLAGLGGRGPLTGRNNGWMVFELRHDAHHPIG